MHNPDKQNCVKIGQFKKPHGVAGTLTLNFEPAYEDSLSDAEVLLTDTEGLLVPWFVTEEGIRLIAHGTALIDLDWIEDEQAARKLCGMDVYIEKEAIYSHEGWEVQSNLTGYLMLDRTGKMIGTITALDDFSGNIVCTVNTVSGEKMVPLHPEIIRKVDDEAKAIFIDLPEGILDL